MRTTIDIDPTVLEDALAVTGEKNRSRVVDRALRELVRRERLAELRALAGNIEIDDNLEELKQLELKEMSDLGWS
jgi:hypothetical protein